MKIRRLYPTSDLTLLREAFSWDAYAPSWYADSDSLFRPNTFEEWLELAHNEDQVSIGIFDDQLVGLIIFNHLGNGICEVHLSAKRGSSLSLLTEAAYQMRHQFFALGFQAGLVWIAVRNRHIRQLCGIIGFVEDGLTMYNGTYNIQTLAGVKRKPIQWVRMVATREQWESELRIAA